jgi:hypothetical protein
MSNRVIYNFAEYINSLGPLGVPEHYMDCTAVMVPQETKLSVSRDTPQIDIYAIWWNSTSGNNSIGENFLGNYSLSQTSALIAFGGNLFSPKIVLIV